MQSSPFIPGSSIVAYLRDSGGDEQDLSVEQQESVIRKWCSDNGLILSRLFTDVALSGSSSNKREQFQDMIAYFRSKPTESGIVVWKFSRFARSLDDSQFYKADLRRSGYIVHSMNDNTDQSLDGRFFESAIDWMNARFLEDLSIDVKRGQRHMLKEYGAIGGVPPRGFKREVITIGARRDGKPHQVAKWVPDETVTPLVKLAFQMRMSNASYYEINQATHLYKTKNCYPTFFSNRLYIGELKVGDTVIPDYCQPVIDRDTWDAVQLIQSHTRRGYLVGPNNVFHPKRTHEKFLLSGLLYCEKCGSLMNGKSITFKVKTQKITEYYWCTRSGNRGCDARMIPAKFLEDEIIRQICNEIATPDNLKRLYDAVVDRYDSEQVDVRLRMEGYEKELSTLKRKAERIANAISDSGHSKILLDMLNDLEDRTNALQVKIFNSRAFLNDSPNRYSMNELELEASDIYEKLHNADNQVIHAAIAGLTDRIVASREGNNVRYNISVYAPKKKVCL